MTYGLQTAVILAQWIMLFVMPFQQRVYHRLNLTRRKTEESDNLRVATFHRQ